MLNKDKVLLIHRYYWPDLAPYGHILRKIGIYFSKKYTVDVISSQPSYKPSSNNLNAFSKFTFEDGLNVNRLKLFNQDNHNILKIINLAIFTINIFFKIIIRPKYKIIFVSTSPPIILGFIVALACKLRKVDLVYHCMDLYPEIGSISGDFKNKYLYKIMKKLDVFTCNNAKKIILLSEDMEASINLRNDLNKNKIHILNNFALRDFYSNSVSNEKEIKIIFAGNIGRFQALEKFTKLFLKFSLNMKIKLIFVGEGKKLSVIKKMSKRKKNVLFYKHQSFESLKKLINECDYGLVSLEKNISLYAFPSKFMTYISAGIKIILFSQNNCEISNLILNNNLGIVLNPNSEKDIKKFFYNISKSKLCIREKRRINKFYNLNYSENIFFNKLNSILDF